MRMDGSWMVSGLASQSAFTFSVAQMPIPADGQPATNMGGEHIVIFNSDEATQQAAFTFVEWLTSTETQIAWDQQTAFMPIRASVAADAGFQAWLNDTEPRLIPYVESQQYAINRPSVQVYPELSDVFSGFMEQALYGQISPEDALASAETAVNALLR